MKLKKNNVVIWMRGTYGKNFDEIEWGLGIIRGVSLRWWGDYVKLEFQDRYAHRIDFIKSKHILDILEPL